MEEKSIISAMVWIPKGFAKAVPKEFDLDEEEIKLLKEDPSIKEKMKEEEENKDDELKMEDYDDELAIPVFASETQYLKGKQPDYGDNYPLMNDDVSEEEKEDYTIKPTDALIAAAKIENEFSTIEVYVYEESANNLFVHHEITLSAFPLALEWLSINPTSVLDDKANKGNFLIVGTFLPEIEIWNLDIVNAIEPSLVLGGELEQAHKKPKKKSASTAFKKDSHTDAVISLALNKYKNYVLCSGSADTTIKLWDLSKSSCIYTYKKHTSKVQTLKWNPAEEKILLSGGFDGQLVIFDVRQPDSAFSRKLHADIENAIWDPLNPNNIVYCTEDGFVSGVDARFFSNKNYLFHHQAHKKTTTSVSMSSKVPGMLATTSLDGLIKIWDTTQIVDNSPLLISSKNAKAGKLYCGAFYEDNPWLVGCGSSIGELVLWDTTEDKNIVNIFGSRVDSALKPDINECTGMQGNSNLLRKAKKEKRKDQTGMEEEGMDEETDSDA